MGEGGSDALAPLLLPSPYSPHGIKSEASFGFPLETKSEASLVLPPLVAGGFQSPGESLKEK